MWTCQGSGPLPGSTLEAHDVMPRSSPAWAPPRTSSANIRYRTPPARGARRRWGRPVYRCWRRQRLSPRRQRRKSWPASPRLRQSPRNLLVNWFNFRRLHGEIGLVPPVEYETTHHSTTLPEQPAQRSSQSPSNPVLDTRSVERASMRAGVADSAPEPPHPPACPRQPALRPRATGELLDIGSRPAGR